MLRVWNRAHLSQATATYYVRRYSHDHTSFERDFQENYIKISRLQKGLLSIGSAYVSLTDPYRADMIACLGETTGI